MINKSRDSVVIVRATELKTKISKYCKLGQACVTNWDSFVLLQIRAKGVINWVSFIITNWGKCCYKLGQLYYKFGEPLLQNRAIITN